jgi:hypothetical protein
MGMRREETYGARRDEGRGGKWGLRGFWMSSLEDVSVWDKKKGVNRGTV